MIIKNIETVWIDPETQTKYDVFATVQKRKRGNIIDLKQVKLNGIPQYQPFSDQQVDSMKAKINLEINN